MKIFGYSLNRNYLPSGECIRCPDCGSVELKENVRDSMEWAVMEFSIDCPVCKEIVGYWAHGYWAHGYWAHGYYDPYFMFYEKSIPALITRVVCKLRGVATP